MPYYFNACTEMLGLFTVYQIDSHNPLRWDSSHLAKGNTTSAGFYWYLVGDVITEVKKNSSTGSQLPVPVGASYFLGFLTFQPQCLEAILTNFQADQ